MILNGEGGARRTAQNHPATMENGCPSGREVKWEMETCQGYRNTLGELPTIANSFQRQPPDRNGSRLNLLLYREGSPTILDNEKMQLRREIDKIHQFLPSGKYLRNR